jgi:hypothetical protein
MDLHAFQIETVQLERRDSHYITTKTGKINNRPDLSNILYILP